MYYHKIQNMSPMSLVFRIIKAQEKLQVKGDWIETVKQNLHELNIRYNDEEMRQIPKNKFSEIVEK